MVELSKKPPGSAPQPINQPQRGDRLIDKTSHHLKQPRYYSPYRWPLGRKANLPQKHRRHNHAYGKTHFDHQTNIDSSSVTLAPTQKLINQPQRGDRLIDKTSYHQKNSPARGGTFAQHNPSITAPTDGLLVKKQNSHKNIGGTIMLYGSETYSAAETKGML